MVWFTVAMLVILLFLILWCDVVWSKVAVLVILLCLTLWCGMVHSGYVSDSVISNTVMWCGVVWSGCVSDSVMSNTVMWCGLKWLCCRWCHSLHSTRRHQVSSSCCYSPQVNVHAWHGHLLLTTCLTWLLNTYLLTCCSVINMLLCAYVWLGMKELLYFYKTILS